MLVRSLAFFMQLLLQLIEAVAEQSELSGFSSERLGRISMYFCSAYGISCLIMTLIINHMRVMAQTNGVHLQQLRARGIPRKRMFLRKVCVWAFRMGSITQLSYSLFNILVALNVLSHLQKLGWTRVLPDRIFAYDPDRYASSHYMRTPTKQVMIGPSTDMNWPVFLSVCMSLFVENFVSVVEDKQRSIETVVNLFELSVIFQDFSSGAGLFLGRFASKIANPLFYHTRPTEQVLVITALVLVSHISLHAFALINGNKYQLIPSTVFGVSLLSYLAWNIWSGALFDLPFILIVNTVPQLVILVVFVVCVMISGAAALFNGGLKKSGLYAVFSREDTQIVSWNDDFFTALGHLGTLAISSAGKASYTKEISAVTLNTSTWVDKKGYENFITTYTKENQEETLNVFAARYHSLRKITTQFAELTWCFLKNTIRRGPRQMPSFLKVSTPAPLVSLADLSVEQVGNNYANLLAGPDLDEEDDCEYNGDSGESDSELETECTIDELLDAQMFVDLITSPTLGVLRHRMASERRITRSTFKARDTEKTKLMSVIEEKRTQDVQSKIDCVICHCNTREIITWPCKCFAICEACRMTLVAKGIEGCVCCRREVEGVSKVFIP